MSTHKHRKGFRQDQVMLSEAYTGIYNESAVDVELDHWWDFDEEDVIRKVYHGSRHTLPPAQGTPEYEENSEKIFIWLKDKYPQPDDYNIDDVEFQSRTTKDATEWAKRVGRDPKSPFYKPEDEEAEDAEETEDDEIGLDIKDPAEAYKEEEGGEGKYL